MKNKNHLTLVVAAVFSLLLAGGAYATEELAETENLACTSCHDKPGSKLLTDQGKYFELMRSMDGFAELNASFGNCTFCHRRKPGSQKLTKAGRGFAHALGNMEALVEWVAERYPAWPTPDEGRVVPADKAGAASEMETETDDAPRLMPAH